MNNDVLNAKEPSLRLIYLKQTKLMEWNYLFRQAYLLWGYYEFVSKFLNNRSIKREFVLTWQFISLQNIYLVQKHLNNGIILRNLVNPYPTRGMRPSKATASVNTRWLNLPAMTSALNIYIITYAAWNKRSSLYKYICHHIVHRRPSITKVPMQDLLENRNMSRNGSSRGNFLLPFFNN